MLAGRNLCPISCEKSSPLPHFLTQPPARSLSLHSSLSDNLNPLLLLLPTPHLGQMLCKANTAD